MNTKDSVNLTRIMRRDGILRIAQCGDGFTVAMRGNILGTGATVGEAYQSAMFDRAALIERSAAA